MPPESVPSVMSHGEDSIHIRRDGHVLNVGIFQKINGSGELRSMRIANGKF